jgi:hypothetical protein
MLLILLGDGGGGGDWKRAAPSLLRISRPLLQTEWGEELEHYIFLADGVGAFCCWHWSPSYGGWGWRGVAPLRLQLGAKA